MVNHDIQHVSESETINFTLQLFETVHPNSWIWWISSSLAQTKDQRSYGFLIHPVYEKVAPRPIDKHLQFLKVA